MPVSAPPFFLLTEQSGSQVAELLREPFRARGLRLERSAGLAETLSRLSALLADGAPPAAVLLAPGDRWPLAAARQIRRAAPDVHLVFLTPDSGEEPLRRALLFDALIGGDWTVMPLSETVLLGERLEELARRAGGRPAPEAMRDRNTAAKSRPAVPRLRERLATILDHTDDAIFASDPEGRIVTWNRAAERIFGWSVDQPGGRSLEVLLPEGKGTDIAALMDRLRHGDTLPVELPWPVLQAEEGGREGEALPGLELPPPFPAGALPLLDPAPARPLPLAGLVRDLEVKLAPIHSLGGEFLGVSGVARDVTERKELERRQERERTRLAALLSSLGEGVYGVDRNGDLIFMNRMAERLLGWTEAELLGRDVHSAIHSRDREGRGRPAEECPLLRVAVEGAPYSCSEDAFLRRDGTLLPVAYSSCPLIEGGELVGAVVAFQDIGERLRTEEERRWAERRRTARHAVAQILADTPSLGEAAPLLLQAVGESLGWDCGALWMVDGREHALRCVETWSLPSPDLRSFESSNRGRVFARGEGLPGAVWAGKQTLWIPDLLQHEGFQPTAAARKSALRAAVGFPITAGRAVVGVIEFLAREARDEERETLDLVSALGGQVGQFLQRKQAETALRESEARKTAVFEAALDAIVSMDDRGRIVEFNPAAERMFGYARAEALGKEMAELIVPPALRGAHRSGLKRYLQAQEGHEDQESAILGKRQELTAVHAEGSEFPVELAVTRVSTEGPPIFIGYIRDISERRQAEEALRASERQFRAVFDNALDAMVIADDGMRYVDVNPAASALFGVSREELLGRRIGDFTAPGYREGLSEAWKAFQEHGTGRGEFAIQCPDGTRREVEYTASAGFLPGRNLSVLRDVTARRQAEERRAFLAEASTLLASSLEYEATLERVVRLAVPELADWCGIELVEEGGSLRQLAVAHRDPARVETLREMARRYPPLPDAPHGSASVARTGRSELYARIPPSLLETLAEDSEHLEILRSLGLRSAMIVPLCAHDHALGALTFAYAESGRRYHPDDLALAEELARRAATAIENARLYRELQQADRAKDEFLAMLAHELRNPLAPILNAAEVMRMTGGDEAAVRAREVVERQVRHMARIVDDLLDVSRITRGMIKLQKSAVDLAAVVEHAVETARPLLDEHAHQLAISLPERGPGSAGSGLWLEADPTRLSQVLSNLLHNAAKYTKPGGQIHLSVEIAARGEGETQGRRDAETQREAGERERTGPPTEAVIRVRDTGQGIPPEMLPHVFDLFTQVHPSIDRSQGGLGLGLTLVRRLVEMHGGTVSAFSEGEGRGSEFTIRLPLDVRPPNAETPSQPEPETAAAGAETPEAPETGLTILLVEDNADSRETFQEMLELWGHRVYTAATGPEGVRLALDLRPDVAFIDIGLPAMDGYAVVREIRQGEQSAPGGAAAGAGREPLRLIALTGYGQPEDRRLALEAGFDDHLVKPLALQDLVPLLADLQQSRGAGGS